MGATEAGLARIAGILKDAQSDAAADALRMQLQDARHEVELLEGMRREHEKFSLDSACQDRVLHGMLAGFLRPAIEKARDIEGRLAKRVAAITPLPEDDGSNYLDAANRDEARFNASRGRSGVVWAGD